MEEAEEAFFGEGVGDGVGIGGVEGFDGVCDGVESGCDACGGWEGEGEGGVVEDDAWEDLGSACGCFGSRCGFVRGLGWPAGGGCES